MHDFRIHILMAFVALTILVMAEGGQRKRNQSGQSSANCSAGLFLTGYEWAYDPAWLRCYLSYLKQR